MINCEAKFVLFVWLIELRKLAKKRKETLSSTRQEMTVMVNSMDKSYTEQGTNCDEAISFMDTHNLNGRSKLLADLSATYIAVIYRCTGCHIVLKSIKWSKLACKCPQWLPYSLIQVCEPLSLSLLVIFIKSQKHSLELTLSSYFAFQKRFQSVYNKTEMLT